MAAGTLQLRSRMDEDTGPPKEWFLGEEWHARDVAAIFRPRWLLAGHMSELTEPGTYLTYSFGADEVLICREAQGVVRAYYNVCSHRGSRLCGEAKGQIGARIVCPYHGWSYSSSTGALLAAPHMHEDFDRSPWGLRPVHVDIWLGLIFVCFADHRPAPMADYIGARDFGGYKLAEAKLASAKTHEIKANWKIIVENNLECYHCPLNHPELMAVRDWKLKSSMDTFASALSSRAKGLEVIQSEIACAHTINGQRVSFIPFHRGDTETDPAAYLLLWEPGMAMILSRDHGWIFSPKPLGPARTELKQYW